MIDGLKPYAAMKNSGVTWLGKVPSHWPVLPNRALFMEVKDRNHPEEEMLSVTITQGIVRQKNILADSSKKDSSNQDKSAYKLVKPRDLAYNKMRAWQGAIGVSDLRGIISPAYVVMRPHESYCPRYFHYLCRTPHFAKEAERWSYGITSDMWSLRPEHFKMIYTSVPTREEQSAIVRFLDRADRRIRRYIRAKQKLIKLLEEQKQAIIHQVVTRGLDPNVRLKPSGVEWLGEVPEHWEEIRLKFLTRKITDGEHISPSLSDEGVPLLSAKDVRDWTIDYAVDKYVSLENAELFWRRCHPERGDLLIVSRGATIGRVGVVDEETQFCLMGSVILCKRREAYDTAFLYYALNAKHAQTSLWFSSASSAQQAIYIQDVAELRLPIPPLIERKAIVAYLSTSLADLNKAASCAKHEISLLREYRTRLIADVVTGKIDVREASAKLPDEPEELDAIDTAEELEGVEDASDTAPDDETVEAVA